MTERDSLCKNHYTTSFQEGSLDRPTCRRLDCREPDWQVREMAVLRSIAVILTFEFLFYLILSLLLLPILLAHIFYLIILFIVIPLVLFLNACLLFSLFILIA